MATVVALVFALAFVVLIVYANIKKSSAELEEASKVIHSSDGFEVDTDPGDDNRYI